MSSGLTVKSIGAAQAGFARPDSLSLRAAIATELDPTQTVTAAPDSPAATDDSPRNAPPSPPLAPAIPQDVMLDPQAREVMFRAMAMRAGQPIDEAREEVSLKLKAYSRIERKKRQADGETIEKTA